MTVLEKWPEPKTVKLTIEDYRLLDEAGAFQAYAKTELIGGRIVAMNAQWSQHAYVKGQLFRRIADACEAVLPGHDAWSEASIVVPPDGMPEPDVAIAAFKPARRTAIPVNVVRLVVEVSDTTASYDLGEKAQLYARGGIAEYWVFDLQRAVIHQMWDPAATAYRERRELTMGDPMVSVTIEGLRIATQGLS